MKTSNRDSALQHLFNGFTFFEDDFKGWMEVPYQLLVDLQIHAQISDDSKRKGSIVYLDEATDFPTFVTAMGILLEMNFIGASIAIFRNERFKHKHQDCTSIRNSRKFYLD